MRTPDLCRRWLTALMIAAVGLGTASMAWGQGRGGGQPTGPSPNVSTDPLLKGFEFRSIGPATMMGRVDDIQGSEQDPMTIYVGFATGGLWKSTDDGNYWHSLFDNMPNESIGSIAIAPSNKEISTWAWERATTGRVRRSAMAFGARRMGRALDASWTGRNAVDPAPGGGPHQPQHRLRRGGGTPVRPQSGSRPV